MAWKRSGVRIPMAPPPFAHGVHFPCPEHATILSMPRTLDDVRTALFAWKGIALTHTANPVMGHGNSHAEIVFVGEAPGQKEDKQGVPFVGHAGKMLDALLQSIGLRREDVYITNIVKFRPPENRDPTPAEKKACAPFLEEELSIIQPRIIAPLGRHAMGHFLPEALIGTAHGNAHVIGENVTVFPLYHPAAALHNPNLRQTLFDDFQKLSEHLASMKKDSD